MLMKFRAGVSVIYTSLSFVLLLCVGYFSLTNAYLAPLAARLPLKVNIDLGFQKQ